MAAFNAEREMTGWRKSSYSGTGGGQCVEVAADSSAFAIRDSKNPHETVLTFGPTAWTRFIQDAAEGAF